MAITKSGFGHVTMKSFMNVRVKGFVPTVTGFGSKQAPSELCFNKLDAKMQQRLIVLALALQEAHPCRLHEGTEAAVVSHGQWLMPFLAALAPQVALTLQPSASEAVEASLSAAAIPSPPGSCSMRRSPSEEQSRPPQQPQQSPQQPQQQPQRQRRPGQQAQGRSPAAMRHTAAQTAAATPAGATGSPHLASSSAHFGLDIFFSPEEYLRVAARGFFDLLMRLTCDLDDGTCVDVIRAVIQFNSNLLADLPRYLDQATVQGVAALMQNVTRGWADAVYVTLTDGKRVAVVQCQPTWDDAQMTTLRDMQPADIKHKDVHAELKWLWWGEPFSAYFRPRPDRDYTNYFTGLQVMTLAALPELRTFSSSTLQKRLQHSAEATGKALGRWLHTLDLPDLDGTSALRAVLKRGESTAAAALHAVLLTPLSQDVSVDGSSTLAAAQSAPTSGVAKGVDDPPADEPALKRHKMDAEATAALLDEQKKEIEHLKKELAERDAILSDPKALLRALDQLIG